MRAPGRAGRVPFGVEQAEHNPRVAAIGLGSNVGDRAANLSGAVDALREVEGVRLLAVSAFVETAAEAVPGGVTGDALGGPYLNAAATLMTSMDGIRLLAALRVIEVRLGRDRATEGRGGPRTIDLDLLLLGDEVVSSEALVVPHPRMQARRFVLGPLAEIAPEMMVPTLGRTVAELLRELGTSGAGGGIVARRAGPSAGVGVHIAVLAGVIGAIGAIAPAGLAAESPCMSALATLGEADSAQPPTTPAKSVKTDASTVLSDLAKSYQQAPTAERVSITVRAKRPAAEPGEEPIVTRTSSEITVRIDPGQRARPNAAGGPIAARAAAMLLELGTLRVHASDGLITVITTTNPGTYWRARYAGEEPPAPPPPLPPEAAPPGEPTTPAEPEPAATPASAPGAPAREFFDLPTPALLAEHLQPIPLPQLVLARPPAAIGRAALLPWLEDLSWETVTIDLRDVEADVRAPLKLAGASRHGSVRLEIAWVTPPGGAPTGPAPAGARKPAGAEQQPRLAKMFAELPGIRGAATPTELRSTIECTFSVISPGDAATWAISLEGRARVETLNELRGGG